MSHTLRLYILSALLLFTTTAFSQPQFKVLGFYSTDVEGDHVQFAHDAIHFFDSLAYARNT